MTAAKPRNAAAINARTLAGSFFPPRPGTSVWVNESTPHGLTAAIPACTVVERAGPTRRRHPPKPAATVRGREGDASGARPTRAGPSASRRGADPLGNAPRRGEPPPDKVGTRLGGRDSVGNRSHAVDL